MVGVIFTASWASRTWRNIMGLEPEIENHFRQKHRSFERKVGAPVIALLLIAGVAGAISGRRQSRLNALVERIYKLGLTSAPLKQRFVQIVSRDTPTMTSYVQRCADLEPVLDQYQAALQQMDPLLSETQQELPNDGAMLAIVTTMRGVLEKDLEGARLIRNEVEYAKKISSLAPADQVRFYEQNIQPIRDKELRVASEEIELAKAAKARGVRLPDQFYSELGIK